VLHSATNYRTDCNTNDNAANDCTYCRTDKRTNSFSGGSNLVPNGQANTSTV
jgi:hypothetical protein